MLLPFRRCYNDSATDAAIIVPIGLVLGDVEVLQVRVRDPDGILPPVVTEGFQVAVVIVLTVLFEVDNGSFLSYFFFHPERVTVVGIHTMCRSSCFFSPKTPRLYYSFLTF